MSLLRIALLHLMALLAGPWLAAAASAAVPAPAHGLHAMAAAATPAADGATVPAPQAGPAAAVSAACGDRATHAGHAPAGDCCDPGADDCACPGGTAAASAAPAPSGMAGTPAQRPDARLRGGHLAPPPPLLLRPPIA